MGTQLEARGISLRMHLSKDISIHAVNRDLLFQLVYNLVNNAVRYNKENGAVIISDQHKQGLPYTLLVKDSGIGIPAKELATIFDRFKKSAGTG